MLDGRIRSVKDGRWCRTRREWINDYLDRITVEPRKAEQAAASPRSRTRRINQTGKLGEIATEFLRERKG
jgi:hypothetical protein